MTEPRTVDWIGRAATIALVTLFGLVTLQRAIRPMLTSLRDARDYGEAIQILSGAEARLAHVRTDREAAARADGDLERALPPRVDLDAFLREVGDIAARNDIHVEHLRPGQPESFPLYRQLNVEARVAGSFPSVYRFLTELEHSERLTRIQQVSVLGDRAGDGCAADVRLALIYAGVPGG